MVGTTTGMEALLEQLLLLVLLASGLSLLLASLFGLLAIRRLRRLELPEGASLLQTLQAVPITVVVAIDLLDFGLDVLAAPLTWLLLRRLRLQALRDIAVIEALFPGTQVLPLMTLAWVLARAAPEVAIWSWPGGVPARQRPHRIDDRAATRPRLEAPPTEDETT